VYLTWKFQPRKAILLRAIKVSCVTSRLRLMLIFLLVFAITHSNTNSNSGISRALRQELRSVFVYARQRSVGKYNQLRLMLLLGITCKPPSSERAREENTSAQHAIITTRSLATHTHTHTHSTNNIYDIKRAARSAWI